MASEAMDSMECENGVAKDPSEQPPLHTSPLVVQQQQMQTPPGFNSHNQQQQQMVDFQIMAMQGSILPSHHDADAVAQMEAQSSAIAQAPIQSQANLIQGDGIDNHTIPMYRQQSFPGMEPSTQQQQQLVFRQQSYQEHFQQQQQQFHHQPYAGSPVHMQQQVVQVPMPQQLTPPQTPPQAQQKQYHHQQLQQHTFSRPMAPAPRTIAVAPQPSVVLDNPYSHLSNFNIEKKIGKGQFSVVYRARCKIDAAVAALKKVQV